MRGGVGRIGGGGSKCAPHPIETSRVNDLIILKSSRMAGIKRAPHLIESPSRYNIYLYFSLLEGGPKCASHPIELSRNNI